MIILKSEEEIKLLRESSRIVAEVLKKLRELVKPGVSTMELDSFAEKLIKERGAIPAFKGYKDYPATLCASINEGVVHGIPGPRRLREGDIISLDLGAKINGYYGDAAITVPVGKISKKAKKLLRVTEEALYRAIEQAKEGNRLYDISYAVQSFAEENGFFSVVRDFVGHGIGKDLHEDPQIPNFGKPGSGPRLKAGMVFAIEPMINIGDYRVKVLSDGWTVVTVDSNLSAHFEHTIAITKSGPCILSIFP
jgi:methionyl aminopeptidase